MSGKPLRPLPSVDRFLPARPYTRRLLLRRGAAGVAAAVTGILGLSLAGCGAANKKNTATPGQTAATGTVLPVTKLTVSYIGSPNDVPIFLARDQDIFSKHGLDVTFTQIPGPTAVPAVLSGQVQIGHAGGSEFLGAAVQGGDLKFIGVVSPVYALLFMTSPDIKTAADLKGKNVGALSPAAPLTSCSASSCRGLVFNRKRTWHLSLPRQSRIWSRPWRTARFKARSSSPVTTP